MSGSTAALSTDSDDENNNNEMVAMQTTKVSRRSVSTLMYACQQGDVELVRRILHVQPTLIYQRDRTGKSALHYCSTSDNKRAAQAADYLVMAAPDLVNTRDEDGFTPLHLAVIAGNMSLVTFLLASKADVNAVDSEKHTVVHWATVCGETDALRAVLAAGAPVSTPDVHGGYPLHYAAQMCGSDKDNQLGFQVLQTLLSHPDISVTVEDGDGRQPLLWAASAGSARAMLALIRSGGPVEAPDKDGLTALHCAASRGHTDCIDTLLNLCGASVDVIDSNGCTALHYAVTLGHADATALLLAHGANSNRQDRKGRSPAHCGCAKGQLETVRMVGGHGANLWLRNARGDLPLHEAAASGRRELVKWLLEARPSQVNARNNDGRCPLHLAALNDNADMCKILLDLGAHINPILRTSKNVFMTPLDCALQRGFRSTAKYLQLQGGLPANKTGNTPISVQFRDDLTLWDSSDESELERTKGDDKRRKKVYKRKTTVLENTKPIDGSPKKDIQEATSPRDRLTYNSEVKILDNDKVVSIKQSRNVSVANGRSKEDETPKLSSKSKIVKPITTIKKKVKLDTPDPRRKETSQIIESPSKTSKETISVPDINENIKEIGSLAQSIEEKAKSICKEVTHIESTMGTESLTSYEEGAKKDMVVEAAVHEPPSKKQTQVDVEAYDSIIKSLKDELELIKNEIKNMKHDGHEEAIQEVSKETNIEVLKELRTLLEGRISEIKNTVEEFKIDIKNVISEGKTTKENEVVECLQKKVEDLVIAATNLKQLKEEQQQYQSEHLLLMQKVQEQQGFLKTLPEGDKSENVEIQKTEENEEHKLVQEIEETEVKEQVIEAIQDATPPILEETLEIHTSEIETNKVDEEVKIVEEINQQNIVPEDKETEPKDKHVMGEKVADQTTIIAEEIVDKILPAKEGIQETIVNKILPAKEGIQETIEEKIDLSNIDLTIPLDAQTDSKEKRKRFIKTDRDLNDQQESSIEAKSSENEEDNSSQSSISSIATRREHKSFTILETSGAGTLTNIGITRPNRRVKKSRSKSEETRLNKENLDSTNENLLKRSKMPTTITQNKDSSKRRAKSNLESRVPILPDVNGKYTTKSETNLVNLEDYSDEEDTTRRKKVRKRPKSRTKSAGDGAVGSDYESSNLIDSGFEPSPRSSRIPKWRNVSDRGVNMTSVTQSIQGNIRRYHLERKIFQHLLELKRMQIRAGVHNEAMLVKRAIDTYHRTCAATVGAGRYVPKDYSFKSFEYFLYDSLRKIQKHGAPEYLRGLPETATSNPLLCTQTTNKCMHATHAYTGIPCAAYLPKMDHHTIPKIGFGDCKPQGSFLPEIPGGRKSVTLELCHGNDKQVISLPTDRLDQNKRYYVTFTVKGEPKQRDDDANNKTVGSDQHRHAKSV